MTENPTHSSPFSREFLFNKQCLAFSVFVGIIAVLVNLLIDNIHTVSDALTPFLGATIALYLVQTPVRRILS
ncbi:hypothetical protein [Haladaptatus pallidirubidus]|uniref:hypothetical protein n=1 Tax=Haladaptatus pallidirubidus TaxID=1008152 RepID=UPI001D10C274|nr:hypothetical protein [Haladaptatus pallidirubidus]